MQLIKDAHSTYNEFQSFDARHHHIITYLLFGILFSLEFLLISAVVGVCFAGGESAIDVISRGAWAIIVTILLVMIPFAIIYIISHIIKAII